MSKNQKVKVTCQDCGVEFEVSISHFRSRNRLNLPWRCKPCYKKWRKENWYNELPDDKKQELSTKRSELSKQVWQNIDKDKKDATYQKAANTRKSKSEKEKAEIREKVQQTWANKSEEEMNKYKEMCREHTQAFWDNMTDEERVQMSLKMSEGQMFYFNNLTDEQRADIRDKKIRDNKNYWANMTPEEYDRQCERRRTTAIDMWNNHTDESYNSIVNKISEGRKRWWRSLSAEQRIAYGQQHSEWWNTLSKDQFQQYCLIYALENNSKCDKTIDEDNKSEYIFANKLNIYNIDYVCQWSNVIKHLDFDRIFEYNPENETSLLNPYHKWDFKIHTRSGDILVDIDGSIHTSGMYQIEFNDSKRPYQTDGMDAYVVLCYDDKLTMDTKVIKLNTGETITVDNLINMLKFENLSDKEQKDAINNSI